MVFTILSSTCEDRTRKEQFVVAKEAKILIKGVTDGYLVILGLLPLENHVGYHEGNRAEMERQAPYVNHSEISFPNKTD